MDVPDPAPGPGEVLVRVAACGVCHTDLHYIDHGTPTFKKPPLILGHEISGPVPLVEGAIIADALTPPYHAVVNRGQVRPGDRVVVFGCGGIGLNLVQV